MVVFMVVAMVMVPVLETPLVSYVNTQLACYDSVCHETSTVSFEFCLLSLFLFLFLFLCSQRVFVVAVRYKALKTHYTCVWLRAGIGQAELCTMCLYLFSLISHSPTQKKGWPYGQV